jgi:hypothetical protein
VPELKAGNAGEGTVGLVAGQGTARALQRLHHDADRDAAAQGRAQGITERLVGLSGVGHQQQFAPGFTHDVGEDDGGGGPHRHMVGGRAAPHRVHADLGRRWEYPAARPVRYVRPAGRSTPVSASSTVSAPGVARRMASRGHASQA